MTDVLEVVIESAERLTHDKIRELMKSYRFEVKGKDGNGNPKRVLVAGFAERNKIVEANTGLVAKLAKKYSNPKFDFSDCYQQGLFGLIKAAETFDPDRVCKKTGQPIKFSTHAMDWIRQAICREQENLHLLPSQSQNAVRYFKQAGGNADTENDPDAIDEVIQNLRGPRFNRGRGFVWTTNKVKDVAKKARNRSVQMSDNIAMSLKANENEDEKMELAEMLKNVEDAIGSLSERDQFVIRARYFEAKSLEEIGSALGVTRQRVQQIEAAAMAYLRATVRS